MKFNAVANVGFTVVGSHGTDFRSTIDEFDSSSGPNAIGT